MAQDKFPLSINLDKDFILTLNKMIEKYGTDFADLNGLGDNQLSFTDFINNFCSSKSIADTSVDANSNRSSKDIVSLEREMQLPHSKLIALNKIFMKTKRIYGLTQAKKWLEGEWNGETYLHDSSSSSYRSYCFAYDLEELCLKGLYFIPKFNAAPPKHLNTYTDFVGEFVSWNCNRTSGAVGLPSFLIYSYYFWKKDKDSGYMGMTDWDGYRDQSFQEIIYRLNQPYLRQGLECVDEQTRILTPSGLKGYTELKAGDEVYTWKDGNLNINTINKMNIDDYEGEMHLYSGRDLKQFVTPNHRVFHKGFNSDKFKLTYSSDLIDLKTPLTVPIAANNNLNTDYDISDESLRLTTIILCDGSIENIPRDIVEDKKRIRITKSPRRGVEDLELLLDKLEIGYTCRQVKSSFSGVTDLEDEYANRQYNVNVYELNPSASAKYSSLLNNSKKDIPDWFFKLSSRQVKIVINTWARYDGSTTGKYKRQQLQCDNMTIAEKIQHLCFLSGSGSKVFKKFCTKNNKKETIYVSVYNRVCKSFNKKEKVSYKGKVWCPTTNDGIVVFEKDGALFFSGNSAFSNFSIFDGPYLEALFGGKTFPDGTDIYDSLDEIKEYQKEFMRVCSKVRSENMMTFPVLTISLLKKEGKWIDEDFAKWACKHNMTWSDSNFYVSDSVDSLSSCCRLKNNIKELGYFNSIGGTSLKVGSVKVNTINLNRIALEVIQEEEESISRKKVSE